MDTSDDTGGQRNIEQLKQDYYLLIQPDDIGERHLP